MSSCGHYPDRMSTSAINVGSSVVNTSAASSHGSTDFMAATLIVEQVFASVWVDHRFFACPCCRVRVSRRARYSHPARFENGPQIAVHGLLEPVAATTCRDQVGESIQRPSATMSTVRAMVSNLRDGRATLQPENAKAAVSFEYSGHLFL